MWPRTLFKVLSAKFLLRPEVQECLPQSLAKFSSKQNQCAHYSYTLYSCLVEDV